MIKRYYYNCPIAAAYMEKNFGMKYLVEIDYTISSPFDRPVVKEKRTIECDGTDIILMNYGRETCEHGTIYIHPDSLKLLEPIIGDLYLINDDGLLDEHKNTTIVIDAALIQGWDNRFDGQIILRNGKAFIWPEVEA